MKVAFSIAVILILIVGTNLLTNGRMTNDQNNNNMSSLVRSFELSGFTHAGEGSTWLLSIKSSDDISFALRGGGQADPTAVHRETTKIDPVTFRKLFEDLETLLAAEKPLPKADAASPFPDDRMSGETITISGIKSEPIIITDTDPLFAKVKTILLTAGFVSDEKGYELKDGVVE